MAVKTWAQLRAAFADNNTGNITAADMRDFVDTVAAKTGSGDVFTPGIRGTGGDPTLTYGARHGQFYQIGSLVYFEMAIVWTARSGGGGSIRLPLPANLVVSANEYANVLPVRATGVSVTSGRWLFAHARPEESSLSLHHTNGQAVGTVGVGGLAADGGDISVSGVFLAAD